MEKIYRVKLNSKGMPNFSTAVEIDTDISEYSDKLWRNAYERGKADRPQGEWKPFDLTWGRSIYACSVCEEAIAVPCGWSDGKPIYDYCPMCGARMKGADDDI